ncbi:DUF1206 domain-containing protein [Lewinella sp. 4G2]|uniref:DUF1206 domain-containing protein n=1 Tax=Lewinella sp. 4G2 TaxID=1803372 RepID=UPI0007E179FD|nr:DUF1206 domain-containing protein [Lewinella sp. 4G2]OAV43970.1 hypothetical protein A3850_005440 [Lewinella sp. 4G2]
MQAHRTTANILLRVGSFAKGLVYLLMGLFCLGTVLGVSYGTGGPKETIAWLGANPYGQAVFLLLGCGILCYALWRVYEAFFDPFDRGTSWLALYYRLNCLIVGGAYGALAIYAFRRLFRARTGGDIRQDALQIILGFPFGQYITYGIALAVIGAGLSALYVGIKNQHMRDVDDWALTQVQSKWFRTIGRIGLGGVAAVYFIMGYSLFEVARTYDGTEFRGVGEALSYLEGWGWGLAMMLVTGVGLVSYGVFMGLRAWYEKKVV